MTRTSDRARRPRRKPTASLRARRQAPARVIPPQVFLFSQIPYSLPHHRYRQIADQFSEWGVPLTYVEESSHVGAFGRKEGGIGRALGRSLKYRLGGAMGRPAEPARMPAHEGGIEIVRIPPGIPATRFNPLDRLGASLLRQTLERELLPRRIAGLKTIALINNPTWGRALRKGDFSRVIYDCTGDLAGYAGTPPPPGTQEYEQALIKICDAVVVTSEPLEAHVRGIDPVIPLFRIPDGVDVEWFQESATEERTEALPEPIVGCVGIAPKWLDVSLIAGVATLLPEVTFLFAGPEEPGSLEPIKRLANVRCLGPQVLENIPSIIGACSACWIPFSVSVEQHIPLALYEYFALGKPLVSTPIKELETYRRRGLVRTGRTSEEIARALKEALDEESESAVRRRVKVARERSWERLIEGLFRVVRGEG